MVCESGADNSRGPYNAVRRRHVEITERIPGGHINRAAERGGSASFGRAGRGKLAATRRGGGGSSAGDAERVWDGTACGARSFGSDDCGGAETGAGGNDGGGPGSSRGQLASFHGGNHRAADGTSKSGARAGGGAGVSMESDAAGNKSIAGARSVYSQRGRRGSAAGEGRRYCVCASDAAFQVD